ncbi:MAG TPA: hypothetical protein VGN21_03975 [Stellaceae bacterium]|jgi:hypothetical protein
MSDRADRNPETAYESSDWHVPAIAIVLAMLLLLVAVAVLALYFGFRTAVSDVQRSLTVAMPQPALQTDPQQDLAKLRAREEQLLNTYYWIDRDKGIVHIPIAEAMKRLVAKGVDGFPQASR